MKLLDLYCGAGGAAMGYHQAGFAEIVGVDIKPQKRYPFTFVQGDAITYLLEHGSKFDVIHASPPCQKFTRLASVWVNDKEYDYQGRHEDWIAETRAALRLVGRPYVIENVVGAPLDNPITLCGAVFGLKVFRHRLFESNMLLTAPPHQLHRLFGKAGRAGHRSPGPGGFISIAGHFSNVELARRAMDIPWMSRDELAQAIPPAYTRYIGQQLLRMLSETG